VDYTGTAVVVAICIVSWALVAPSNTAFAAAAPAAAQVGSSLTRDDAAPRSQCVWLGFTVQALTPDIAASLGLPGSGGVLVSDVDPGGVVVIALDPRGAGAASGLETIDVIELVDGRPVGSAAELSAALAHDSGRRALLFIDRDGLTRFLTLPVDEP
jgi:serine protease Do